MSIASTQDEDVSKKLPFSTHHTDSLKSFEIITILRHQLHQPRMNK